jgi:hypothetical protein
MNAKLTFGGGAMSMAIAALCALGCGGRAEEIEQPVTWLEQSLALGDKLVLITRENPRAFLIDVSELETQEAQIVELPEEPLAAWKRNGANEALVLCQGRRASADQDAEPAVLAVVESDGDVRRYPIGGDPFDSLTQSEDGRYAFLFKKEGADRLLGNPNEVAIVDLDEPDADLAVEQRTLRSFGDSPQAVVFSPTMNIVGQDRRLAVVLSQANVTLIDLDHLDRVETTVQLSSPGGGAVAPAQVLFNPDAPEIYVRGSGSDDVFVFNLAERPPSDEVEEGGEHNDFRPFIDQLGIGGRPSDMVLYAAGADGARLLVLANGSQAAVVTAGTSQVTSVELPEEASRALLFEGASPRDREMAQRALLYREGGAEVTFLDLEDLEARGSRNLEVLPLDRPIVRLIPMPNPEEQRVLIIHGDDGVSLVDLEGRTISPLTSSAQLTDALFDATRSQLWVGPSGQPFVGLLELDTGETPEVLLDEDVDRLVPMFDAGHMVVLHRSAVGHLTVLDAERPTRESARSLRGFVVADLLDRGE